MGESSALKALWDFCAEQKVFLYPSLECRSTNEAGSAVYATRKISKGQKIVSVPTKALFTTANIPESFVSLKARKKVPVHALLAAYLTFGASDGEVLETPGSAWVATWPKLSDFTSSMPMLWPDECLKLELAQSSNTKINGKHSPSMKNSSFAILPPPTSGAWSLATTEHESQFAGSTCIAVQQKWKLKSHLDSVAKLLPHNASSLENSLDPMYWQFTHNWCCVNTRCFYYVAPGQKKPEDPNEAMAMCPGMDMFNHTDHQGCITKYDRTGYNVVTDQAYEVGEEVLFSYGAHNNDTLWAEYGFLLEENRMDAIRIDKLVVEDLSDKQKNMLAEYGYFGEFWLEDHGVSWNVEVAARLFVLSKSEWLSMIRDGVDPIEDHKSSPQIKKRTNSVEVAVLRRARLLKVKRKIVEWLLKVKVNTEASLQGLSGMTHETVLKVFADDIATLTAQGVASRGLQSARTKQALQRRGMCVKRWGQIWEMCMGSLRAAEQECPGSFIAEDSGRTVQDLNATLESVTDMVDMKKPP